MLKLFFYCAASADQVADIGSAFHAAGTGSAFQGFAGCKHSIFMRFALSSQAKSENGSQTFDLLNASLTACLYHTSPH
jgi:hypothetical protein